MDGITEKLGFYDIFGTIVPGLIVVSAFVYLMPMWFYNDIKSNFTEVYEIVFIIFVFSYLSGVILHEMSAIFENFIYKKSGKPRNIFLKDGLEKEYVSNEIDKKIFKDFMNEVAKEYYKDDVKTIDEKEKNQFLFSYCLSYAQLNGFHLKSEKFQSLLEMYTSLSIGLLVCAFGYVIYGIKGYTTYDWPYFIKLISLLFAVGILFSRRRQYQEYRIRSLVRTCIVHRKLHKK